MKKNHLIILILLIVTSFDICHAQIQSEPLSDLKKSVFMIGEGAVKQFQTPTNLYGLPLAVSSLIYSFEHDKRISNHERSKRMSDVVKSTESLSILFNFPIIPIGAYYLGHYKGDEKLTQFGIETFSTLYLALIESAAISLIPVHDRPDTTRE